LDTWRFEEGRGYGTVFLREANDMAVQLGKRYLCETCGTEVLCNKPGAGSIVCCDKEMAIKEAKPLPSSD
jgi:ribosomal protein L37AE/L43A